LLRQHRVQQDRERLRAGQLWNDGDWLFATETGEPINPRADWNPARPKLRLETQTPALPVEQDRRFRWSESGGGGI
jgi:hypothetical protein